MKRSCTTGGTLARVILIDMELAVMLKLQTVRSDPIQDHSTAEFPLAIRLKRLRLLTCIFSMVRTMVVLWQQGRREEQVRGPRWRLITIKRVTVKLLKATHYKALVKLKSFHPKTPSWELISPQINKSTTRSWLRGMITRTTKTYPLLISNREETQLLCRIDRDNSKWLHKHSNWSWTKINCLWKEGRWVHLAIINRQSLLLLNLRVRVRPDLTAVLIIKLFKRTLSLLGCRRLITILHR